MTTDKQIIEALAAFFDAGARLCDIVKGKYYPADENAVTASAEAKETKSEPHILSGLFAPAFCHDEVEKAGTARPRVAGYKKEKGSKRWTEQQNALMLSLINDGISQKEMPKYFVDRTRKAVQYHYNELRRARA